MSVPCGPRRDSPNVVYGHGGGSPFEEHAMCLSFTDERSRLSVALVATALFAFWSCAPSYGGDVTPASEDIASATAAAGTCDWDPTFGTQYCFEGDWWIEFSVRDSTVESMEVEIANPPGVVSLPWKACLADGYSKFVGGPDGPLPAGTSIRLRATQTAAAGGHTATSAW